jgi:hypothetical protein
MDVVRLVLELAALAAVGFMSAWTAYICLRRRPSWIVAVINLSFWIVPVALLMAVTGQPWKSFGLGTTIVFVVQRLHWLKWKYTSDTWTAADLLMLLDPANWFVLRLYPFVRCRRLVRRRPRAQLAAAARRHAARLDDPPGGTGSGRRAHRVRRPLPPRHEFDPFGFNTYGHFANLLFSVSSLRFGPACRGRRQPPVRGTRGAAPGPRRSRAGAATRHRGLAAGVGDRPAGLRRGRSEPADAGDARARCAHARERLAAGADLGRQHLVSEFAC